MSASDILAYEVQSSWWACNISIGWMQTLAGYYFAWKVRRIVGRFATIRKFRDEMPNLHPTH